METDLFDKNGRKKRSKLSKKERVEMSALLPVEENEKDEDETDEYFWIKVFFIFHFINNHFSIVTTICFSHSFSLFFLPK